MDSGSQRRNRQRRSLRRRSLQWRNLQRRGLDCRGRHCRGLCCSTLECRRALQGSANRRAPVCRTERGSGRCGGGGGGGGAHFGKEVPAGGARSGAPDRVRARVGGEGRRAEVADGAIAHDLGGGGRAHSRMPHPRPCRPLRLEVASQAPLENAAPIWKGRRGLGAWRVGGGKRRRVTHRRERSLCRSVEEWRDGRRQHGRCAGCDPLRLLQCGEPVDVSWGQRPSYRRLPLAPNRCRVLVGGGLKGRHMLHLRARGTPCVSGLLTELMKSPNWGGGGGAGLGRTWVRAEAEASSPAGGAGLTAGV
jgi:hypothetical protein